MTPRAWLSVLALVCLVAILLSLFIGTSWIAPAEVMSGFLGNSSESVNTIVQSIRLPRAILAAIVGAGLGASGAALQGFTRNPLAAPGLLGFSACAALGAVLALYFNFSELVTPTAIGFALLGALAMTAFSRRKPGASGLVLAGIGIGALATAVTGLVMNFAPAGLGSRRRDRAELRHLCPAHPMAHRLGLRALYWLWRRRGGGDWICRSLYPAYFTLSDTSG